MRYFATLIIVLIITLYGQDEQRQKIMANKVTKSESEWAVCLTPEEYRVLREKGTEMAFTGKYYKHKDNGKYVCCLLYTSPSPRDGLLSRMPSSA